LEAILGKHSIVSPQNSYTRTITCNAVSYDVWNLMPKRRGSALFREKYQGEKRSVTGVMMIMMMTTTMMMMMMMMMMIMVMMTMMIMIIIIQNFRRKNLRKETTWKTLR
jgi:hypothetical protein